jgi:Fe-S cluster assembly iron-binding protein IscA
MRIGNKYFIKTVNYNYKLLIFHIMKTIFFYLALFIGIIVSNIMFTSCSGDEPFTPNEPGGQDTIKVDPPVLPQGIITVKAGEDLATIIASAQDGSEIRVAAGKFIGGFEIKEGVSVSGAWNNDFTQQDADKYETVLDGQNMNCVLKQSADFQTETIWSYFTIQNGSSENGAGVFLKAGGVLEYSTVSSNHAQNNGGGVYIDKGAKVRFCKILDNETGNNGGGAYIYGEISNSTIARNSAANNCGGGVQLHGGGEPAPAIFNCIVAANTAKNGGGIRTYNGGKIYNSLIWANEAVTTSNGGAGITLNGLPAEIINCTIVENNYNGNTEETSNRAGGITFGDGSSASTVVNCIIWGNKKGGVDTLPQCRGTRTGIAYCAISGGDTSENSHVIPLSNTTESTVDLPSPQFLSVIDGNFELDKTSPCVNAGANEAVISELDINGNARIVGDIVDLGAFENQQ